MQFKGYIPLSSTNAPPLSTATINVCNYVIIREIHLQNNILQVLKAPEIF